MRALCGGLISVLCGCASMAPAQRNEPPGATAPTAAAPTAPATARLLTADTPSTTVSGATFVGPAGWTLTVRGPATILEPPEPDSHLALVDVQAKDADAAVAAAWAIYRPDAHWPLLMAQDLPDQDGWSHVRSYDYQTSPNEKRGVSALTGQAAGSWTVVIFDMPLAVSQKRTSAISLALGHLSPRGYTRESFAGKRAHPLDEKRLATLTAWVERAMKRLGVPGVAVGVVQGGKTVLAQGFGVRELGKSEKPDADTLFMIASNTKALTTLMLGKLVEQRQLTWDTPVTTLLPGFKLGDADTTRQVRVRHLICACTGLPRQDLEWIFQFEGQTPAGAVAALATMQPTSKFGEMYQYSNPLAGAAGYVGGHVLFPSLELGAAYDEAMRTQVFEPLGMKATTFDAARAQRGNHATAHAPDVDGKMTRAITAINSAIVPLRPAGAAWSNVHDLLRYVSMELAEGALPDGTRYIAREPLLERRVRQVSVGEDDTYGMGLSVGTRYGTPVVNHGGFLVGFHSDMMWLPEHGVGAVVLSNGNPGWILYPLFERKLLEVLFDGKPEADAQLEAQAKYFEASMATDRKQLTVPADSQAAGTLAKHYAEPALGELTVSQAGGATFFDFGEWKTEVASRRNPDGTVSFVTLAPGMTGFEFVVGSGARRTLIIRDAQHEYTFTER